MTEILKFFFNDVRHFMAFIFLMCVVSYSLVVIIEFFRGRKK